MQIGIFYSTHDIDLYREIHDTDGISGHKSHHPVYTSVTFPHVNVSQCYSVNV